MGEEAQQPRGKGCDADCVVCKWTSHQNNKETIMYTTEEWICLREMIAQEMEEEKQNESKDKKTTQERTDTI